MTTSLPKQAATGVAQDYSVSAAFYDTFRRPDPQGVQAMCASLEATATRLKRRVSDLYVAAICCGTGAHESGIVRHFMKNGGPPVFHLVDLFEAMLEKASTNIRAAGGDFHTHQRDVTCDDFSFVSGNLDWASMVYCWHHFDRRDAEFSGIQKAVKFAYNAIAPGGTFTLISSGPEQCRLTRWYQLAGEAAGLREKEDPGYVYASKWPKIEEMLGYLFEAGFKITGVHRTQGPLIYDEWYYDPKRLLNDGHGAASFFDFAKARGLWDKYYSAVMKLVDDGRIEDVIQRSEIYRKRMGVGFMIEAIRL